MGQEQLKWRSDAGPIQTKRLSKLINDLFWEARTVDEIGGVKGVNEHRSTMTNVFGDARPEAFELHKKIFEDFNGWIRTDNHALIAQAYTKAIEELKKTRPVEDKTTTEEEISERNKITEERQEKHREEARAIADQISLQDPGGEGVIREEGEMIITIQGFFNDSDLSSDYNNRHHSITGEYCLGVVRKQARTEALARSFVARIPELSKLEWKWHVEEYSMGHGTYLESGGIGSVKYQAYDGRSDVVYWYEISFNQYIKEPMMKSRFSLEPLTASPSNGGGGSGIVRKNEEKNGMEVKFPGKPDQEVIDYLKASGFHWSRAQRLWYKRFDERLFNEVRARFEAAA